MTHFHDGSGWKPPTIYSVSATYHAYVHTLGFNSAWKKKKVLTVNSRCWSQFYSRNHSRYATITVFFFQSSRNTASLRILCKAINHIVVEKWVYNRRFFARVQLTALRNAVSRLSADHCGHQIRVAATVCATETYTANCHPLG